MIGIRKNGRYATGEELDPYCARMAAPSEMTLLFRRALGVLARACDPRSGHAG